MVRIPKINLFPLKVFFSFSTHSNIQSFLAIYISTFLRYGKKVFLAIWLFTNFQSPKKLYFFSHGYHWIVDMMVGLLLTWSHYIIWWKKYLPTGSKSYLSIIVWSVKTFRGWVNKSDYKHILPLVFYIFFLSYVCM